RLKSTGGFLSPEGRSNRRLVASRKTSPKEGGFMRTINGSVRRAVLQALACASGLVLAAPGRASADAAQFDIAAQPMPSALKNFAVQAKMQLLYRYEAV